jgi:hypothetical protein
MLIDALRRLASGGFPIADYQYTGMGSIHFYDFSLLHRYAGINQMLSVEASKSIRKRVEFNCPYAAITVRIGKVGSEIRKLSPELSHLLWLDYDSTIQMAYLADVTQAILHCRPGSIILATVDIEAPRSERTPTEVREYFQATFGDLLPANQRLSEFTSKNLYSVNGQLLWRAIQRGLNGREGISFQLLFNFVYQDGHRMLTIGGMVVDDPTRLRLKNSAIWNTPYVRKNLRQKPYNIRVPVITRKERLYLDSAMPCKNDWRPTEFEIGLKDLKAYRDIYRFAPQFAELIL